MKKRIFSVFVGLTTAFLGLAQATLPTSCDFSGSQLPSVGWTTSLADYYTASGKPAPAMKFASTGRNLIINVASSPGTMTFDIAGNSLNASSEFEVQESVDGSAYTTVANYNKANLGADQAYENRSVTLNSTTRFIKFIYVNKGAGNIGLDNVVVNAASVTHQELTVQVNNATIANNSNHSVSSNVGVATLLPFKIKNTGSSDPLSVSAITISGANASDFALATTPTYPLSIAGSSEENIGINFTPTATGTRTAKITITSNDLDFPTFTFDLTGYGGGLATEPAAQPTNLIFSNVKTYRIVANFTASANTDGYLVLRKQGSAITEVPVDGTTYSAGDMIGGAKVVKSSASTTFTPNDILANSNYYFAVFAYNGVGAGINYNTTSPLTGNQQTPATMVSATEYDAIVTTSPTLLSDLHGLVAPHFQNFYSDYATKMVDKFQGRDTTNGKKAVTCAYTGNIYMYDYPFNFTAAGMSREHTFANSWFPTQNNNANFYSDYHNLFLVNQNDANAIRSNYPLGVVVSDTIQAHGNSYYGKNANGQWVYEPRDEQKGTAARAMFYMMTRYTENGTTWKLPANISASIPYGQDQAVLKQWNTQFPPTKFEITRNDYIDSLQNNRNPFIDHPEYACFIDFTNMTHNIVGCELNVTPEQLLQAFIVYPNPAKETVTIAVDGTQLIEYRIFDVKGQLVQKEFLNDVLAKEINVSTLDKGIYIITATTEQGDVSRKVVIE